MAEIICVIGNKGGTGKTTLSHMLCQGLGLLGQRAACVLTDTSREPARRAMFSIRIFTVCGRRAMSAPVCCASFARLM